MKHLTDSQLNEYIDEACVPSARRELDAHLQSCAECRARLQELQLVFSDLAELHETRMPRDLTSAVIARLPQKQSRIWTPFFAAQLGTALGVFLWLSMQAAKFIPSVWSELERFSFPQLIIPTFQFVMPVFQFYNLNFPSLTFDLSIFNLQFFNFPTLQLSTINLILVSVSVFLLWLVGNLSLLRSRSGVQK